MCVSKIGQTIYGVLALFIVALTLASMFTPGWRKIKAEVKQGEDHTKIINQTISLGIFPFSCGWELGKSELHLNKSATDATCEKWWENQPTYEKFVLIFMILALLCAIAAFIWNALTFCCCIGKGIFRPLPSLASASALLLLIVLIVYYFNNDKDIEVLKAWDNIKTIDDNDISYSFFLALGAFFLSLVNCFVGSFVMSAAEKCC
uniref:Clc-like protein n=1 Tax=Meloidogyne hapla TaxID=6305 RepID=A0A1I8BEU0_MELHA